MKLLIFFLIIIPIFITTAQQEIILRNHETDQVKRIHRKTILSFKTSDSTIVTGRIIAVADSSFRVATYKKRSTSDTVDVHFKSVSLVTNKLLNRQGLANASYFFVSLGAIGLITSPLVLITDPPDVALGLLEASAVFIGVSGLLYSPYLIQRNFNTTSDWTIEAISSPAKKSRNPQKRVPG